MLTNLAFINTILSLKREQTRTLYSVGWKFIYCTFYYLAWFYQASIIIPFKVSRHEVCETSSAFQIFFQRCEMNELIIQCWLPVWCFFFSLKVRVIRFENISCFTFYQLPFLVSLCDISNCERKWVYLKLLLFL